MQDRFNKLQKILDSTVDNKLIFGTQLSVRSGSDVWTGSSGILRQNQPYFIASTTKMFITALVLKLKYERGLNTDSLIAEYLDNDVMKGLHVYHGKDYSSQITINHLLSHRSGLPDYFQGKPKGEKSLLDILTSNQDAAWSFEDAVNKSKYLQPHFIPGAGNKAFYSDTNFQLLGRILEKYCQQSLSRLLKDEIFEVLGLSETYIFDASYSKDVQFIFYRNAELHIPLAMSSFWADGGIVSNSGECLKFLWSFFNGNLFPQSYLQELYQWRSIFFPLKYGIGISQFKLPRIFSPFSPLPEFIGHSGLSGAFAFYCPSRNLYLSGTVNQIHKPGTSFRMMLKVAEALKN